jgi:hypothetical protein
MKAFDQSKEDESADFAAFLAGAVSDGASSKQVAEIVASAFRGIDQVLMPIIGQRGVAALYKRSVHLAGQAYPWLPRLGEGVHTAMDVSALTTELALQSAAVAAAAGGLLLQTFCELLTSLIGASLSNQLLRTVWATLLSGPSAQETKP